MAKCKSCGEKLKGIINKKCENPSCLDYYCPNMGMNGLGGGFSKIKSNPKNIAYSSDASNKNQKIAKEILDNIDNLPPVSGSIDFNWIPPSTNISGISSSEEEEDLFCKI